MKPDLTGFPKGYKRPNVLFTVAEFRSLEDDMHMGKISYSRMIEIINEKAKEYAKQNLLNKPDVIKSVCVCKEKRGTFLGADNKYRCSKCFELVEQTVL